MKNELWKRIIIGLIIVFSAVDLSLAGDSGSISVSCTIPAIPGVNVPLITEKTKEPDMNNNSTATAEDVNPAPEEINNTIAMFQKDTEEIRQVAGENYLVTLNTIYTR